MIEPKIDDLLAAVDSKYSLVILAAKRAREINATTTSSAKVVASSCRRWWSPASQQAALDRARGDRPGQDRLRAPRGARDE